MSVENKATCDYNLVTAMSHSQASSFKKQSVDLDLALRS